MLLAPSCTVTGEEMAVRSLFGAEPPPNLSPEGKTNLSYVKCLCFGSGLFLNHDLAYQITFSKAENSVQNRSF